MRAANVLIRQDMAVSMLPGKFAHIIFSTGGVKGHARFIGFSLLAPFNQCCLYPFNKIISSALSLTIISCPRPTLNCGLWLSSLSCAPGKPKPPECAAPICYGRDGGLLECLNQHIAGQL